MRVLAHEKDFAPTYNHLKIEPQKNRTILNAINDIRQQLEKSDRPLGIHHRHENIPTYYKTRYHLQALYHFEMPMDYRLMYTVRKSSSGDGKEALFLELLSHDQYNKRFGYFKKRSH